MNGAGKPPAWPLRQDSESSCIWKAGSLESTEHSPSPPRDHHAPLETWHMFVTWSENSDGASTNSSKTHSSQIFPGSLVDTHNFIKFEHWKISDLSAGSSTNPWIFHFSRARFALQCPAVQPPWHRTSVRASPQRSCTRTLPGDLTTGEWNLWFSNQPWIRDLIWDPLQPIV